MPARISKRLLARLKHDYPLLAFLPGFLLGQFLVFEFLQLQAEALFLAFACTFFAILWYWNFLTLLFGIVGGIFSAYLAAPGDVSQAGLPDKSYIAQVMADPQFPKTGQVQLSIQILGELGASGDAQTLAPQPRFMCKAVNLPWKNVFGVKSGDRLLVRAAFTPLKVTLNPFSYPATLWRHGYAGTCKFLYVSKLGSIGEPLLSRFRQKVRAYVFERLGDGEAAGLTLAMSIGARDLVSEETEQAFKITGLAHLLVASGYQVTLLFASLLCLLKFIASLFPGLQAKSYLKSFISISAALAALSFVALVGFEGSVLRAMFAIVFLSLGQIFERGRSFLNSILLSLLLLSLVWPGSIFEPGVQLTFAALFSLALGAASNKDADWKKYLKSCLLASLSTSAVSLAWFGRLSLWGVLLNPVFAPFGAFVGCKLVLLSLALGALRLPGADRLLLFSSQLLNKYRDLVFSLSNISGFYFEPSPIERMSILISFVGLAALAILLRLRSYILEFNLQS